MLLERAETLAEKINSYQRFQKSSDEADRLETRADQFGRLATQIADLLKTLNAFAEAGIPVAFTPNDGPGYAEKARILREAIKTDPAIINDPPFDIKYAFCDRLSGIVAAGYKIASATWKAYVEKRADFGAENVLNALAQVPQFRASVAEVRAIRHKIISLGEKLPVDIKAARIELDTLISQHNTSWTSLAADDIPASVITFIRAAATSDALLITFTTEVRAWLESRDLLGAFRITLR